MLKGDTKWQEQDAMVCYHAEPNKVSLHPDPLVSTYHLHEVPWCFQAHLDEPTRPLSLLQGGHGG